MILVIEIMFLLAGGYALISGKLPGWFVGKGYKAEGTKVRLLGGVMAATLPVVFCGGFVLGFAGALAGFDPTMPISVFEFAYVIILAIIVAVVVRNIRVPEGSSIIMDQPPIQPPQN
jgi:hypothetical protein